MTPLTQQILEGISADDSEAFLGASETIRAFKFGTGANVSLLPPYAEELALRPPQADDISAIKLVLTDYLTTGSDGNLACAVYALGVLGDPDTVPLLRETLRRHLRILLAQNQVVGNLICALSNNGEGVISGGSYSLTDIDKNVGDARRYLGRFGEVVPW
jgi:hypothetical protein